MFLITTAEGKPAQLVAGYAADTDAEKPGIWTWSGFWANGTATKLTPGLIIKDWAGFMFGEPNRSDMVVVKVNRVTVVVQRVGEDGIAYGPTATVRIDR